MAPDFSLVSTGLSRLHGLPLRRATRAADMLVLQFGREVPAPTRQSPNGVAGEYALHVQCPWRISGPAGVVVGARDLYVSTNPSAEDHYPGDRPGTALADELLRGWFEELSDAPIVVRDSSADRCGGFVLSLSASYALETFPDAASRRPDEEKQWRLFSRTEDWQIVVRSDGIEACS